MKQRGNRVKGQIHRRFKQSQCFGSTWSGKKEKKKINKNIHNQETSEDSNNEMLCVLGKLPAYNYGRLLDRMRELHKSAARVLFSTNVSNDAGSYWERKTERCRRTKKKISFTAT
jgi:hypothetical protein